MIVKHMLTGLDGETYDVGRILGVLGALVGLGLLAWDVIVNKAHFDMQNYGIGFGALTAGVGAMLKLKETQEPK